MEPIHIPSDRDDTCPLTFTKLCTIRAPQSTEWDWRRRGVEPRGARFMGCGRPYITTAEGHRLIGPATPKANRYIEATAKVRAHV
jgi:hypothetical protein